MKWRQANYQIQNSKNGYKDAQGSQRQLQGIQ